MPFETCFCQILSESTVFCHPYDLTVKNGGLKHLRIKRIAGKTLSK